MRTRRLGTVAGRLGLTPSGVSHALARLRHIFQDPFVPAPFDRRPAHAARDRNPGRRECGLAALARTVEPSAFDPASIRRIFRIAALDFGVTMLAPHLIELIARHAPGVQFSFVALSKAEALRSLADGQIDIAVAVFREAPPGFRRRVLAKESFMTVAARKKHPKRRDGLSLFKMQGPLSARDPAVDWLVNNLLPAGRGSGARRSNQTGQAGSPK